MWVCGTDFCLFFLQLYFSQSKWGYYIGIQGSISLTKFEKNVLKIIGVTVPATLSAGAAIVLSGNMNAGTGDMGAKVHRAQIVSRMRSRCSLEALIYFRHVMLLFLKVGVFAPSPLSFFPT